MYTDNLIVYIKIGDIYKDIAEDIEKGFDTSSYELWRPLPKGKNKKVIGLMKSKLGRTIMTELVALKENTCSYLIDDSGEIKKEEGTKKILIKKS